MKTNAKAISLLALTLSIGLTACSGAEPASDSSDPASGPEQDLTASAGNVGNWDCGLSDDDTGNAAIEELSIRTTLKGSAKADLDVSGPGDFFETYHYKAKGSLQPGGDVLIKGASFNLSISADADATTKEHAASLTATGPKSAELFSNEKITAKLVCVRQTPEKVAKKGETCGSGVSSTVVCAEGLSCKSNCPAGAKCFVAINTCQ